MLPLFSSFFFGCVAIGVEMHSRSKYLRANEQSSWTLLIGGNRLSYVANPNLMGISERGYPRRMAFGRILPC